MKYPLKPFTIAVTGDFGESRGHDKMKQWIIRNGGKFAMDISPEVTHLICSKEHYKKAVIMGMIRCSVLTRIEYLDHFKCRQLFIAEC